MIVLGSVTIGMIRKGESPKGDILSIAEVAGIMAAKNTSKILPLCHPLLLDAVRLWFDVHDDRVEAHCEVSCSAKTGVEMEALVGLNAALLTIYDLAKAVDPVIEIGNIFLEMKEGGKSGTWHHPKARSVESDDKPVLQNLSGLKFAVGTLSDRASQGVYSDVSGEILKRHFSGRGAVEVMYEVIPDERANLESLIMRACERKADVLLLTGGTGLSKRDITPDVVAGMASKELSGFGEIQRQYGSRFTKASWLSRPRPSLSGTR
ncbi:MAG: bifunctional molybdenum cofactor biosynthesis protein MoaC/MoaB [Calothrix sp. SM1_5_4]|nr:bifunctional molybdenum cofactor biosynthesis protein MoaC/MoaB [Calothrix sp. SM1_5_4]